MYFFLFFKDDDEELIMILSGLILLIPIFELFLTEDCLEVFEPLRKIGTFYLAV